MFKESFSKTQAEILLAMVVIARSISFVMTKIGLRDMGSFTLLSLRFVIAFFFLLLFQWKRLKRVGFCTIGRGMVIGLAFFAVMMFEISALKITNASTIALLVNTAIVFVPLFEAILLRRFPKLPVVISVLVTFVGVALIILKENMLVFTKGEVYGVAAAVLYACAIIITNRLSRKDDPIVLGMIQVGAMGIYSMIGAFLFETPRMPATTLEWQIILALAIICSCFGFTLQPLAQSKTTSERAGLFCALSPGSAAIQSKIFLNEQFGIAGMLGIPMILFGMVVQNLINLFEKKKHQLMYP